MQKELRWNAARLLCKEKKNDRHRQCPAYLSHSLLQSLCLSLPSACMFMYGHRQFHITCVPTAVWASACVCLCQWASFVPFPRVNIIVDHMKATWGSANPPLAEPSFNSFITVKSHGDLRFSECYMLQRVVKLITALDEHLIYSLSLSPPHVHSVFKAL